MMLVSGFFGRRAPPIGVPPVTLAFCVPQEWESELDNGFLGIFPIINLSRTGRSMRREVQKLIRETPPEHVPTIPIEGVVLASVCCAGFARHLSRLLQCCRFCLQARLNDFGCLSARFEQDVDCNCQRSTHLATVQTHTHTQLKWWTQCSMPWKRKLNVRSRRSSPEERTVASNVAIPKKTETNMVFGRTNAVRTTDLSSNLSFCKSTSVLVASTSLAPPCSETSWTMQTGALRTVARCKGRCLAACASEFIQKESTECETRLENA